MKTIRILLVTLVQLFSYAYATADNYATIAKRVIKEKTGRVLSLNSVGYESDNIIMMENDAKGCFVLLCKHEFDSILASPVLAYSAESSTHVADGERTDMKIMKYYDQVLTEIKSRGKEYRDSLLLKGNVDPMLSPLALRQKTMDMSVIGMSGKVRAGCVPIAATQIMYYYSWPKTSTGKFVYYRPDNGAIIVNMENISFSWPETLEVKKGKTFAVPKPFLILNGMLFNANFGADVTGAYLKTCKRAFINHYKYSRKMLYGYFDDDMEFLKNVCVDLDAARPVICGRWNHAFVCDGYKDGYLHFNMGWGGYFNGYFRIFPNMGKEKLNDMFELINGIVPERNVNFTSKSVSLTKAGTLAQHITEDDYNLLGKLKVAGPINGDDIALLRQLSGAAYFDVPFERRGVLSDLDLSQASIVEDSAEYYVSKPIAMKHSDWEKHNRYNNCYIEEIVPDEKYSFHYFTNNSTIGYNMFTDCDNLEYLAIPESVMHIMSRAFSDCYSLRRMTIPKGVVTFGSKLFEKCIMIDSVSIPKDNKYFDKMYVDSSHNTYWFISANPFVKVIEY
ncbi:MAG: C10 family peptidase [Bacteroidaceae bacterium]|nr:C10 family peptidase [Bacteroidaceae bacterium]